MRAITAVKPGDGFEHWHQVTCRSYSLTECRRVVDRRFRAAITMREIGALSISEIYTLPPADDPIQAMRRACDIRTDPRDYFMLWLLLDGRIGLAQNGHTTMMRAGDLFFYDQSQPFELNFGGRSRALMVTIPGPLLAARVPGAHQIAGRRLSANPGLGALAASVVQRIYRLEDDTRKDVAQRLGASALDMLVTTLEAEADAWSGSSANERRLAGAKRFMLANLENFGAGPRSHREIPAPRAANAVSPVRRGRHHADPLALAAAAGGELQGAHRREGLASDRRGLEPRLQRRFAFQPHLPGGVRAISADAEEARRSVGPRRRAPSPRANPPAELTSRRHGGRNWRQGKLGVSR